MYSHIVSNSPKSVYLRACVSKISCHVFLRKNLFDKVIEKRCACSGFRHCVSKDTKNLLKACYHYCHNNFPANVNKLKFKKNFFWVVFRNILSKLVEYSAASYVKPFNLLSRRYSRFLGIL